MTFSQFHWVIGAYSHFTALRLNRLAVLGKVNAFLKYSDVIMQNQDLQTFYVGCYTDSRPNSGLNLIHLDTTSGELSQGDVALATSNPSYLIEREHGIYTFNETSEKEGSKLHFLASSGVLHSLPSEGDYPCHIDINQQQNCLALAHYVSGNVNLYALSPQGVPVALIGKLVNSGSGPNQQRQESSHAHMVTFLNHRSHLMTIDLGTDSIHVYQLDPADCSTKRLQTLELPAGSGPRHMVLNTEETRAWVVCELSETLVTLEFHEGAWESIDQQPLLPGSESKEAAAAIKLSPDGRFIYVSCRGQNKLVQFDVTGDKPMRVAETQISGDFPRDFVVTRDGQWVLVANQHSHSIESFARCTESGTLKSTGYKINSYAPVCLVEKAL